MKNMQMFCIVYKSTKVYWVKKQKLFVSLQRARREVWCVRVCSSVHANMRIKAAGWDGFGSDIDAMGRPTLALNSPKQQQRQLASRCVLPPMSSMHSSWARCYILSSWGAFQSLWDLQCGEECQWSLWWLPRQWPHDVGKGLLQISYLEAKKWAWCFLNQ